MTIGELSPRSGLPASCIRYYERIGLLPKAARISGRRTFDEDALRRLAVAQKIDELEAAVRRFHAMKGCWKRRFGAGASTVRPAAV